MSVYVHVTDIFDTTTPTAMEQRIKNAFKADENSFWGNFFVCGSLHPNDRIIYFFTEYQLELLWNWWNGMMKAGSAEIRENLTFSRQKLFMSAIKMPDEKYAEKVRVCSIKRMEHRYELKRVLFGRPAGAKMGKNQVNFFDGGFKGGTPENMPSDAQREDVIIRLLAMRPKLEKEFGGPGKQDKKWLRYWGAKLNFAHQGIDYCPGFLDNCPW